MALESTPPSFDSGEIRLGNPPRGTENQSHIKNRMFDELKKIYELVLGKVEAAVTEAIAEFGGVDIVMRGLNCSGYSNITDLQRAIARAVATFHSKLAAQENMESGDVLIVGEECKQTTRSLLQKAFMDHGASLRQDLENLRTRKISGGAQSKE